MTGKDLVNPYDFLSDIRKRLIGFDTLPWGDLPYTKVYDNYPPENIYHTDNSTVICLALAGFKKEDISIERGDNKLVVSGTKKEEEDVAERRYTRHKIATRSFTKSYPVSNDYKEIEATMNDGMLTITLQRDYKDKETKLIEIQ